jgi:hypothetical protein
MRSSTFIIAGVLVAAATAAVTGAALLRADESAQALRAEAGDLSTATTVEVRDASGRAVLSGSLAAAATDADGDLERKAPLAAMDGTAAAGEAEIEISKARSGAVEQELEVDVKGLAASTAYTIHVDGRAAGAFTTDASGEAEVELSSAGKS